MKRILLIFTLIGLIGTVKALNPQLLINQANNHYVNNEYNDAIVCYHQVLDAGYISAGLYYNLGNAYFKSHNIKNAILYYEKAKLLDPADKDIDTNLEFAKNQTFDKIESIPGVFFVTWLNWLQNLFSKDGWAYVSIFAFVISLSMLLLYLLTRFVAVKKASFWLAIVILMISAMSYLFGYQISKIQSTHNKAIIFSPTVVVKSSPSDTGTNLFIIHEGTKVEILDKISDWDEIKTADGNRGWINQTDMEII